MIVRQLEACSPRGFVLGEESGLDLATSVGGEAARLHSCQRGQISLLVLFMGLVFYALIALVWNTGEVTSAKMEAQTAADAAAYSSAVWTSRAMNVTAGTNMLILRHLTAAEAAMAGWAVAVGPWIDWSKAINSACAAFGPGAPICIAAAWVAVIALEVLPRWVPFMLQWFDGFLRVTLPAAPGGQVTYGQNVYGRIVELFLYQQAFIDAVPYAIERQRLALEDYYDCEITLIRGDGAGLYTNGTSAIAPPLKRGNPLTISAPLVMRSYWELLGNKPDKQGKGGSWYYQNPLKFMLVGNGQAWWTRGVLASLAGHWTALGWFHHVPTTQIGPAEFSPDMPWTGWEEFTVVAAARKRPDNSTSMQPPRQPLGFMAPGIFNRPVNPVAYAQAETFNGMDGHTILPWKYSPVPWRVWTTYGWQWQPRLTHGAFFPALADDLLDFPVGPAVDVTSLPDLEKVSAH